MSGFDSGGFDSGGFGSGGFAQPIGPTPPPPRTLPAAPVSTDFLANTSGASLQTHDFVVTAGDLVVIFAAEWCNNGPDPALSIVDSWGGLDWSQVDVTAVRGGSGGRYHATAFWALANATGNGHAVVNSTVGANMFALSCQTIAGADPTTPVPQTATAEVGDDQPNTTGLIVTLPAAPDPKSLIVGFLTHVLNDAVTDDPAYTNLVSWNAASGFGTQCRQDVSYNDAGDAGDSSAWTWASNQFSVDGILLEILGAPS